MDRSGKPGKILIIDDDEDVLEVEGALLEDAGFIILSSDSMEDGLRLVESEHPDVVLLDLVFPEDPDFGRKAARILKNLHPTLPIFLVTAINRSHLTGIQENDSDFDAILIKPVDFDSLIKLIEDFVQRSAY